MVHPGKEKAVEVEEQEAFPHQKITQHFAAQGWGEVLLQIKNSKTHRLCTSKNKAHNPQW
jgi:hypothetical protein